MRLNMQVKGVARRASLLEGRKALYAKLTRKQEQENSALLPPPSSTRSAPLLLSLVYLFRRAQIGNKCPNRGKTRQQLLSLEREEDRKGSGEQRRHCTQQLDYF